MNNTDKLSLTNRPLKSFATVPNNEIIVSMITHKDILIVATRDTVYQLSEKGVFTPIMFEVEDE